MSQRFDNEIMSEGTTVMHTMQLKKSEASKSGSHAADRPASHTAAPKLSRKKAVSAKTPEPKKGGKKSGEQPPRQRKRLSKKLIYMLCIVAAILAVVVTAIAVRRISDAGDYELYLNSARDAMEVGSYGSALTALRKADAIRSSDELRLLMADCYTAEGNYEKALEVLRSGNISSKDIADRIAELESLRSKAAGTDTVTIAGKVYSAGTTSLALNDAGLGNDVLEEIAQLYSLTALSLSGNRITDISLLASLGGLESLDISGNGISDLSPLSGLTELRSLNADENPISDFSPLYSLSQLFSLSVSGTGITAAQSAELSQALPGCAVLTEAGSSETSSVVSLGGKTFDIDSESIVLTDAGISDISALAACRHLKYLDLSGNSISDITPLMSLPSLETLVISNNIVSNLYPLMGMGSLRCLHLEYNPVSDITALTALGHLSELYLTGDSISSYDGLSQLNYLETLDLTNTGLTNEQLSSLSSCFSLRLLTVEDNPELTGNAVDALKKTLKNCHVTHSRLPYTVTIGGREYLDNVTELELSGQNITDILTLTGFKSLVRLDLSNNAVSNIYALESLQAPRDLTYLNLADNQVTDINPIAGLKCLETLDLSGNRIATINPLLYLTNLKELFLYNCGLSEENILRICNALPNCNVHY